jgi:hypothetical protein
MNIFQSFRDSPQYPYTVNEDPGTSAFCLDTSVGHGSTKKQVQRYRKCFAIGITSALKVSVLTEDSPSNDGETVDANKRNRRRRQTGRYH